MLRSRISGLPVVDADERVIGIVTESDLLEKEDRPFPEPPLISWHGRSLWRERLLGRYRKATGTTAREIMTQNTGGRAFRA
jgi:CBS-domain-containing membrane protein